MKLSIDTHAKAQLMRLLTSLLAPSLPPTRIRTALLLLGGLLVAQTPALAQGTGTIKGTVTQSGTGNALVGVVITVNGTSIKGVTNPRGMYTIENVPAGPQTVTFRWLGYRPVTLSATVTAKGSTTVDAKLEQAPVQLSELLVTGASKVPERAVEAPAAFSIVEPRVLQAVGLLGQAPMALREVPGVDIVQSGMNDFNVNARGFNSSLNRRVLVLQDGRDLAIAFLGSQEWNAMAVPTDEFSKMELVRGPGSALYGANAFFGVLNITTPSAREVAGTKLTLGGGFLRPHHVDETGFTGASLRADARTAGTFMGGRMGYRLNAGYNQSDSWSRSRTSSDCLDMRREYAEAVGEDSVAHPVQRTCEILPLKGQSTLASDKPDPTRNIYGSGRLEYYLNNGSVLTAEAGDARVQNELFVTGIGRVQVTEAWRPYARLGWASKGFNVMAYWNARNGGRLGSASSQYSLASGALLREKSNIFHVEAQNIQNFAGDKARLVFGGSARNYRVNTLGTLMRPKVGPTGDDDRSDYFYATFAQLEYQFSPRVRGVAAARVDLGSLVDPQFSPKLGIVFTPNDRHSFRVTVNRAFQLPNYSEFFLAVPAGAPANFSALETGLRASALGPALAGVPVGQLFTCVTPSATCPTPSSAAVPVVARGNANLIPETTLGFETGWRGDVSPTVYVTLDAYFNRIRNFVTDLLPGINKVQYPYWTAPTAVPASARAALVAAVQANLASSPTAQLGLSRDLAGNTAIILSYGNAGKVTQWGLEGGAGWQMTRYLRGDATLTLFDYSVDQDQVAKGDSLLANTPSAKGTLSVSYAGRRLSASGLLRVVKGYSWAAGVFAGFIEPNTSVDANVGYDVSNNLKLFVTGTNVLDNRKYALIGGSVNGRRILGGVTTRF